ncbi:hypothetical protein F443_14162 [Phytophthora nicotianae P1569]|uniref:Uncharacterized protein n=1 Tax=Phytophthora nicotianae P1569 TaxID=1317065 RepID=V9ENG0_PHYNI|nr:hypothetical protein F443_14162 [Phytophthora nicotianae P1569]
MRSRLRQLWESLQVELHGKYSTNRVLQLFKYTNNTSWLHVITVLIVTPLPCLLVTVLVDILPLADPAEGASANKLFFLRDFVISSVLTFICIHQFRINIPVLPYPIWRAFVNSIWISVICVATLYALVITIGFPMPFSMVVVTPVWITLISISMAIEWMNKIRKTPGAEIMMNNVIKVWICQVTLESIYPPYYYVFTILPDRGQMVFALILPVIKLAMRNFFARTVVHLTDEMPEVIVFNVEVFNALFVSYCMQNSPSTWTTLELMFGDIAMILISVQDMESIRRDLKELELRIGQENSSSSCCALDLNAGNRRPTTLDRTQVLLEQDAQQQGKEVSRRLGLELDSEQRSPEQVKPSRNKVAVASRVVSLPVRIVTNKHRDRVKVQPTVVSAGKSLRKFSVKLRYTRKVQTLLYMAEFLLLLNYVEVVIPLVFSIYMFATYQLPNREYYSQLHGMTQTELMQTLENVMFYCLLQTVSLLLLIFILQRKVGLSPMHQLAYVLEKQYSGVQTRLVFWVFYNVQASLQHFGYDYTFRFLWLHNTTNNGM